MNNENLNQNNGVTNTQGNPVYQSYNGQPVQNFVQQPMPGNAPVQGNMMNGVNYGNPVPPKKKTSVVKIILFIFLGIFIFNVIIISIVVVVAKVSFSNSDKLVCKSDKGSITIVYNDNGITGYSTNGYDYDLDAQKQYAQQIGVDAYMDEFNDWFVENTGGTCTDSK